MPPEIEFLREHVPFFFSPGYALLGLAAVATLFAVLWVWGRVPDPVRFVLEEGGTWVVRVVIIIIMFSIVAVFAVAFMATIFVILAGIGALIAGVFGAIF